MSVLAIGLRSEGSDLLLLLYYSLSSPLVMIVVEFYVATSELVMSIVLFSLPTFICCCVTHVVRDYLEIVSLAR